MAPLVLAVKLNFQPSSNENFEYSYPLIVHIQRKSHNVEIAKTKLGWEGGGGQAGRDKNVSLRDCS